MTQTKDHPKLMRAANNFANNCDISRVKNVGALLRRAKLIIYQSEGNNIYIKM